MANEKLQVSRALLVIPNDIVDIPFPSGRISGTSGLGSNATSLVDLTATFITSGVKVGDVIYGYGSGIVATVTGVNSETALKTEGDPFLSGSDYIIFPGDNNSGCVLFIGAGGVLDVITAGGDQVSFSTVNSGQFLPVQVKRVLLSSTATDILALW